MVTNTHATAQNPRQDDGTCAEGDYLGEHHILLSRSPSYDITNGHGGAFFGTESARV